MLKSDVPTDHGLESSSGLSRSDGRERNTLDRPQSRYGAWPELMRPDTLMAYLDCRSVADYYRKFRVLEERGYPGMDPDLHRHRKSLIDQYLDSDRGSIEARKQRMLRAARREPETA
jgi:hypothetical protein